MMTSLRIDGAVKILLFLSCFLVTAAAVQAQHDSQNCTLVGRWAAGPCRAVSALGNAVFFGNGGYLEIVDFTDPAAPVETAKILTPSYIDNILLHGNLAFVSVHIGDFMVFDVTDLSAPLPLPSSTLPAPLSPAAQSVQPAFL